MIRIDVDLTLLANYLGISSDKVEKYKDKELDEILETEMALGNSKAADFVTNVLKNPDELVKFLKLANPYNRLKIIKNMSSNDLLNLLPYLDKEDLMMGLNFFTTDKLLDLIEKLPKNKILKITARAFPLEKYIKLIPEDELNKFLESDKIKKSNTNNFLEYLETPALQKMVEGATGQPCKIDAKEELLNQIKGFSEEKYKKGMLALPKEDKTDLITNMIKDDKNLIFEFSKEALAKPLEKLDKEDIIKNMQGLEVDDFIDMIKELPQELIQTVATQIDPQKFAEILSEEFLEELKNITIN